ncbi:hypothetical protein ANO14919_142820 [Xylariales sp. No.14919]|nr:hypothetical protein ANO14919_142820 [Xylariales sp. No.14919]
MSPDDSEKEKGKKDEHRGLDAEMDTATTTARDGLGLCLPRGARDESARLGGGGCNRSGADPRPRVVQDEGIGGS